jgi:glycosyltransferase involved in cell wall biosynthesis
MRIAYVCQAYRPMVNGPAVVVQHLAEGMCRRGHGVLVLTASDTGRTYVKPDSNLRLSGLTSVPNPFRVGQRIMLLPRNAVLRELDAFRPQLIHPHEPLGIGLASIRLARSAGIPVIVTVHALPRLIAAHVPDYPGLRPAVEEVMWSYARWVAAQCDTLIAPTPPISRRLQ